jgi:hypothetical protein
VLNEPFDDDPALPPTPQKQHSVNSGPGSNRSGSLARTALLVALPLAGAAAALFWVRQHPAAPAPVEPPAIEMPLSPLEVEKRKEQADIHAAQALKSSGEGSSERIRAQVSALTPRPEWQSWIAATPDLVETLAVIIANVSDDDDPRRRLVPLQLSARFDVAIEGNNTLENSASTHRFDSAVEVIASVDARAFAALWRVIHPLVAVAYHSVARPGVSVDRAASNALKRIELMQIPATQPPIKQVGKLWLYTDAGLEGLGSVEKQLLRMGPANARRLQEKARELRVALALP